MNTNTRLTLVGLGISTLASSAVAGPLRTFEASGTGQVLQSTGLPQNPGMADWSMVLTLDPAAAIHTDGAPVFRDYILTGSLTIGVQSAHIEALMHVVDSDAAETPDEVSFQILTTEGVPQGDPGQRQELKFYDFSRAAFNSVGVPTMISPETFATAFATSPGTNNWQFGGAGTLLEYEFLSIDSYNTVPAPGAWGVIGFAAIAGSRRTRR